MIPLVSIPGALLPEPWSDAIVGYQYHSELSLIRLTPAATSRFSERFNEICDMIRDVSLPGRTNVLVDVTHVVEATCAEELRMMPYVSQMLLNRFGGRVAIVNCTVGHATLSQLAAIHARSASVQAFVCEQEAVDWLEAAAFQDQLFSTSASRDRG